MALTQTQIIALINEIQTGADYPATKMNPLLNDILTAAYGPMYIGDVAPSNTTDENAGYRPGSIGYHTQTQRYYVCQSATAGNAVWVLIPADSNFQIVIFPSSNQNATIGPDISVIKITSPTYDSCSILLPSNPYTGKTVVVYFDNAQTLFSFKNSLGVLVVGGNSLAIPAGQQYTFTYSGTAWEIVGINNSTAGSLSGINVSDSGGTVTTNTNNLTFLGSAVTVVSDLSGGTDITINPVSGIEVTRGTTVVNPATQINFTNNFALTTSGTDANIAYVARIPIKQDNVLVTNGPGFAISTLNFAGSMFSVDPVTATNPQVDITLNGAKTWTGGSNLGPGLTDDITAGYSRGSIGYQDITGDVDRTYVCVDNTLGAAKWRRLTEDYGTSTFVPANGAVDQIDFDSSNVILTIGASISSYFLRAPQFAYLGKRVFIYFERNVGTFYYSNTVAVQYQSPTTNAGTSIVMVCTDEALQTWKRTG